jgi:hypothetical protein
VRALQPSAALCGSPARQAGFIIQRPYLHAPPHFTVASQACCCD